MQNSNAQHEGLSEKSEVSDPNENYSSIKSIVLSDVHKGIEQALIRHLTSCILKHHRCPTPESQEQLEAVEVACREILEHTKQLNANSAYKTDLRGLPGSTVEFLLAELRAKAQAIP